MNGIVISEAGLQENIHIEDQIILIYQYFVHPNMERHKEIQYCLRRNTLNKAITKIILLNERKYSDKELGISSDKISQIVVGNRLLMSQIFDYVEATKYRGYFITCNADIFFDNKVLNIYKSRLSTNKSIFAQLRVEYSLGVDIRSCKVFGPRSDSQDSWILHSNYNIPKKERKIFRIPYGVGGCDNKFAFLFNLLGYTIINDPYFIPSYHYHTTQIRNYEGKPLIPPPYFWIVPHISGHTLSHTLNSDKILMYFMRFLEGKQLASNYYFNKVGERNIFLSKIKDHLESTKKIQVCRTTSTIADILFWSTIISLVNNKQKNINARTHLNKAIAELAHQGLTLADKNDLLYYLQIGQKVISESVISLHIAPGWEWRLNANAYKLILDIAKKNRNLIMPHDILVPRAEHWIDIVKDKKVLIISKYYKTISEQIQHRDKIYNKEIFPNCTFNFINIPVCHGSFKSTINNYLHNELHPMIESSDIILIGNTPYSYCILDYMRQLNRTTIDVGDLLPLYFGIYDDNVLKKYPDLVRIYLNENWIRV